MKKFHDKWKHDKYEDDCPRAQQREKPRNEETRKFSKDDSSGCREDYIEDENKSRAYSKPHSYQMERRSRIIQQAFVVNTPKYEAFQKHEVKKNSCHINTRNEQQDLHEASNSVKQSDYKEHYKTLHQGVHPLCPDDGKQPSKYRAFKDMTKLIDTRMKSEKEPSSIDDAEIESFRMRKDSNEITFKKENPTTNVIVKNTYFSNESNLQKCGSPPYELNQSSQYYNKQNNDQSNVYFNMSKETSQSDNIHIGSQTVAFINNYDPTESYGFYSLKLTDLIHYNTNLMQGQKLFEFAAAVKFKILEKIDKFPDLFKEQLEFLCEITDGDHTERNQLRITERTCHIVKKAIDTDPYFLNTIETPLSSQLLVYQTVPNFHVVTNNYCNNYESQALKIVQTSEMLSTSVTDYNLMSDYNIAQNDKYVISKGISNSCDIINSNDYRENCKIENCNANNVKSNSSFDSSLNTEDDEDIAEESSKYYHLLANFGKSPPDHKFSFDEEKSIFSSFTLANLLQYNANVMQGNLVFDYGFSMKKGILQNIDQFEDPYKEKLKFLCELTDGTQRVENQKLINERMLELINDYKDEMPDEDKKWFLKVPENVYSNQSQQRMSAHRQNFSDRHPRNIHSDRSHKDELMGNRKNFSNEQSLPRYTRKSHYEERVVHEYKKFSDGQSKNLHLRRSQYKEEMVQNFPDRQSRNTKHQSQSHYEDEKVCDSRQKFTDRESRNAHLSQSQYEGEKVCDSRRNFSDRDSRNRHHSQSHYEGENLCDSRQNFSDRESRNAHQSRSHYEAEKMCDSMQNYPDKHSRNRYHSRSHYEGEKVHDSRQNIPDKESRNSHQSRSHYEDEKVHESKKIFYR